MIIFEMIMVPFPFLFDKMQFIWKKEHLDVDFFCNQGTYLRGY